MSSYRHVLYEVRRQRKNGQPGKKIYAKATTKERAHQRRAGLEASHSRIAPFMVTDNYGNVIRKPRPNRADKIRTLAERGQYGHSVSPQGLVMVHNDYHEMSRTYGLVTSLEEWNALADLLFRYHRFLRYAEEEAPGWRVVETIHFADNSIEVVEVSQDGKCKRQRLITPPSGDRST